MSDIIPTAYASDNFAHDSQLAQLSRSAAKASSRVAEEPVTFNSSGPSIPFKAQSHWESGLSAAVRLQMRNLQFTVGHVIVIWPALPVRHQHERHDHSPFCLSHH
jgi:hypothetical protein